MRLFEKLRSFNLAEPTNERRGKHSDNLLLYNNVRTTTKASKVTACSRNIVWMIHTSHNYVLIVSHIRSMYPVFHFYLRPSFAAPCERNKLLAAAMGIKSLKNHQNSRTP